MHGVKVRFIISYMFTNGQKMAQQAQGNVVLLPKKTPREDRGLQTTNAGYKISARVIANRLKPI